MVDGPGAYRWSSYHRNALGQPDPVIVFHGRYRVLGRSEVERQEAYSGLFTVHVEGGQLPQSREAWQTGTPLGDAHFKEQVEGRWWGATSAKGSDPFYPQAPVPVRPDASLAANGWFNWTTPSSVARSPSRFSPRCRAWKQCG